MELRHGPPQEVGMLPERVQYTRDLCARWVKEGHTPTLGVCVARRGVIVLHEALGVLGPGPESPPLERKALFAVASITKPITATLVVCSAFRGRREGYANLTVKKIPKAVLSRCEWGKDDYSLKVESLPQAPPPPGQQELKL